MGGFGERPETRKAVTGGGRGAEEEPLTDRMWDHHSLLSPPLGRVKDLEMNFATCNGSSECSGVSKTTEKNDGYCPPDVYVLCAGLRTINAMLLNVPKRVLSED